MMRFRRKLRLIATGGTIACVPTSTGLMPGLGAAELLERCGISAEVVDCVDLFNMDSSNIQPEEWVKIAAKVLKSSWDYEGVVITHGTDTMAYTASMLTFMLQNIGIPVVLTGSQYPIGCDNTDAVRNLTDALIAADRMTGGVYISFGGSVMLGCRTVKTRTTSLDAFESINYPNIGIVKNGVYAEFVHEQPRGEFRYYQTIDPRVALIKLIPGASPKLIELTAECDIRGVVVEAFGLGGVHNVRRDHAESLKRLKEQGIHVVLTSQCLYEASTPDIYGVSKPLRDAGVISAADMTTEAAVTKLMWVLGQTGDDAEAARMMRRNYCGEISESPLT